MLVSHCLFGAKKDGFMMMTLAAGFNGTVDTSWGGAWQKKIVAKYHAGVPCAATSLNCKSTVFQLISYVAPSNGKPSCTGRTTRVLGKLRWDGQLIVSAFIFVFKTHKLLNGCVSKLLATSYLNCLQFQNRFLLVFSNWATDACAHNCKKKWLYSLRLSLASHAVAQSFKYTSSYCIVRRSRLVKILSIAHPSSVYSYVIAF